MSGIFFLYQQASLISAMQDGDHKSVVHLVLSRLFRASPINSEANRRQVHGNEVTAVSRPLTGTCGWEEAHG